MRNRLNLNWGRAIDPREHAPLLELRRPNEPADRVESVGRGVAQIDHLPSRRGLLAGAAVAVAAAGLAGCRSPNVPAVPPGAPPLPKPVGRAKQMDLKAVARILNRDELDVAVTADGEHGLVFTPIRPLPCPGGGSLPPWRLDGRLFDPVDFVDPTVEAAAVATEDRNGKFVYVTLRDAAFCGTAVSATTTFTFFAPNDEGASVRLVAVEWFRPDWCRVDLAPKGELTLADWIGWPGPNAPLAGAFRSPLQGRVVGPVSALSVYWDVPAGAQLEMWARRPSESADEVPWSTRSWAMRVSDPGGRAVARLGSESDRRGAAPSNPVRSIEVAIPEPAVDGPVDKPVPSLMADVADRRSAVAVEVRPGDSWSVAPGLPRGRPAGNDRPADEWWAVGGLNEAGRFDRALVECGYDVREFVHRRAVRLTGAAGAVAHEPAAAAAGPKPAWFQPGGRLAAPGAGDGCRCPFRLEVVDVEYRAAADDEGDHVAVLGNVSTEPAWVSLHGCLVEVSGRRRDVDRRRDGGPAHERTFEFITLLDRLAHFTCLLRWHQVVPVADDLIVRQVTRVAADRPDVGNLDLVFAEVNDAGADQGQLRVYLPQEVPNPRGPDADHPERPPTLPTPGRADVRVPMQPVTVERAADLLSLRFDFENLGLVASTDRPPRLVRHAVAMPARLAVHFPPQHLAEEAVDLADEPDDPDRAGVAPPDLHWPADKARRTFCRIAGESRLCFLLRAGENVIPLATPQDYLDWNAPRFEPSLQAVEPLFEPARPDEFETAIELPYKLFVSPAGDAGWAHRHEPSAAGGGDGSPAPFGHELWHTRLAHRGPQGGLDPTVAVGRVLRAAWTPDLVDKAADPVPRRTDLGPPGWPTVERYHSALVPQDRRDVVGLTYRGDRLIEADLLMLTALAGSLTSAYWGVPGSGFESWQHRATMGRDHFVRVVRAGILYPYGFRAAYIRVSERKFVVDPQGERSVAYLTVRRFIEVRDGGGTFANRNFPAARCAVLVAESPNLQEPDDPRLFWPTKLDGTAVQWPLGLQDKAAAGHSTHQALLFVANRVDDADVLAFDLATVNQLFVRAAAADRTLPMFGARVAFAENERATAAAELPAAAAGDGPAAGDPAAAAAAVPPDGEASSTSYDTHEIEVGASVDRGSASAEFQPADVVDVLGLAAAAFGGTPADRQAGVWFGIDAYAAESPAAAVRKARADAAALLNELWTKTGGDLDRFRKALLDASSGVAKIEAGARKAVADLFNEMAKDPGLEAVVRRLAAANPDKPGIVRLLAIYDRLAAAASAAEAGPAANLRRLVEAALPDAVSRLDEVAAIFGAKLAAVEMRDVRSVVRDLGVVADEVGVLVMERLGNAARDVLGRFDGLDLRSAADAVAADVRAFARGTRLELYEAFERAEIALPPHVRRLRERLTDAPESFEALNRKLLEFWAGIRFRTLGTFVASLASVLDKPHHRLRALAAAIWDPEKAKAVLASLPAAADGWRDEFDEPARALLAPDVLVGSQGDALRRWLRDELVLPLLQQELAARVVPSVLPTIRKLLADVPANPALDAVAEAEVLARAEVVSFLSRTKLPQDAVRLALWSQWLEETARSLPADRVAAVLDALDRLRAPLPPPLRSIAVMLQVDNPAAPALARLVAAELFGATFVDDFRGLVDKLVPAADELAKYVGGRISAETKKLLAEGERGIDRGRAAAERLAADLNLLLADARLFERSARTLVARAIADLRTEAEAIGAAAASVWAEESAKAKESTLTIVAAWRRRLQEEVHRLVEMPDGLRPEVLNRALDPAELERYVKHLERRLSTRTRALLRDLDAIVDLARSGPTAERLERLNRLLLRMRFPRSITDPKSYLPTLRKAVVSNPAVAALTAAAGDVRQTIEYAEQFVRHGFDKVHNAGELFCKLTADAGEARERVEAATRDFRGRVERLAGGALGNARAAVEAAKERLENRVEAIKRDVAQALRLDDLERQLEEAVQDARGKLDEAIAKAEGSAREAIEKVRAFADDSAMLNDLRQAGGRIAAAFPAAKLSGLALPDMTVSGLSRKLGNVAGDLQQLAKEQLDPFKYFPSAKILGKLDLKEVVKAAIGGAKIPKFVTDLKFPDVPSLDQIKARVPERITATLDWKPEVQELLFFKPLGDPTRTLRLTAKTETRVATGQTSYSVVARLEQFAVVIGSFIEVRFESCEFRSSSGEGSRCDPKVSQVIFKGPLAFVETLQKKLGDLFGGGFNVDVLPTSINVSLALALPDVAVGVFAMKGLRLATGLSLPLRGGDPLAFHFRFADRGDPFLMSVGIFGGTGFFAIELQTGDKSGPGSCVKRIEAALEFGGFVGLNLGVAAGSVCVMGGVYFAWERTAVTFRATLRITGHLCVLGIVSVTVEFLLALSYVRSGGGNYAEGSAEVRVRIKIGFFSKSFGLRVHRRIAGSGGSGSVNGADGPLLPECRTMSELEAAAERAFDGNGRGDGDVGDEMSPGHFDEYWAAFAR